MPGRQVGFDAVEDFAGITAEWQQFGEWNEIGVGVYLLFLQVGGTDFGALAHQLEIVGGPVAILHRLQDHAVRRRAERNADQLAFQVGQFVVRRVLVHHHAVAGAIEAIGADRDKPALALRIVLESKTVHHQRIIAHHAKLQFVGHHAVGDRRSGRKILPLEFEFDIGVFGVLRQIALQQMKLPDDGSGSGGVGGGILGADADSDRGLRAGGIGGNQRRCGGRNGGKKAISWIANHCRPLGVRCASGVPPVFNILCRYR